MSAISAHPRLLLFALVFLFLAPSSLLGEYGDYRSTPFIEPQEDSVVQFVARKNAREAPQVSVSVIRDFRYHIHPEYTRVVLDLKNPVSYTTRQTQNPAQIIIYLPNTILGTTSRKRLEERGFPSTLKVTDSQPGQVSVTLDMQLLSKYEIMTLIKPHRLVFDLYPAHTQPEPVSLPSPKLNASPLPALPSPPSPKSQGAEEMLIILDPGHGGKDPGALGRQGTREKDIVLKIAIEIKAMIEERLGARVLLTREKDVFVKLEERAEFANSHKADLFVSIHVNSHRNRSVKGLELYHFGEASDPRALEVAARENGMSLDENGPAWQFILADKLNDKRIEDSRELAWTTQTALVKYLKNHYKVKDHGVKTAPFFVLRMTTMPGILAEIAFVSNPTEEKLLRSQTYQTRVAEGIFKGISGYVQPLQTASR